MKHIKGFDGLRAISIVMVLFTHSGIDEKIQQIDFFKNNYNLISGTTGVNIFFVLSGFLITQLLLQENKSFGNINFKLFFARRFLRLTPPFLVLILVVFCLMVCNQIPANYIAVALSFFYLYNFVEHVNYVGELGHTWSLAVEEQFYLLWPFILAMSFKFKNLFLGLFVFLLLCIGVKYIYVHASELSLSDSYIVQQYYIDRWFIPAAFPIVVGALASILLFNFQQRIEKIFQSNYWVLFVVVGLYFIQLLLPSISLEVVAILLPISVSLLLLWIYFNQENVLVSVLNVYPVAFIGKISYGIYIFQGLFLRTGPGGSLWIQQYPLNLFLVFAAALASYFLLEKPVLKLKTAFVRKASNTGNERIDNS